MDEYKKTEVEKWIKKALSDYHSALKLMDGDKKILDTAIYHCQQAAEKILKSFLVYQNIKFENVPVGICRECGERIFKGEVLQKLEELSQDRKNFIRELSLPVAEYD